MSTSELSLGPAEPSGVAGALGPAAPVALPEGGAALPGGAAGAVLGPLVERLANEYFAGGAPGPSLELGRQHAPGVPMAVTGAPAPGPLSPPSGVFPSATSLGALGVSPGAGWVPPAPGFMQSPPIASGPPPKEADLRTAPAMLSEGLGISTPVGIARGLDASPEAAPYFLELAGLPSGYASGGGVPAAALGGLSPAGLPSAGSALGGSGAGLPPGPSAGGAQRASAAPELGSAVVPGAPGGPSVTSVPLVAPTSIASAGAAAAPAQPPAVPASAHALTGPETARWSGYDARELSLDAHGSDTPRHASMHGPQLDRGGRRQFDAASVRNDFPILKERVHGRELVWLDNAATTQKPRAVIDRISHFYEHENSNIHRAAHTLAARATDAYEGAREATRRFLNAASVNEIIFVRGTTEAINLVAQTWGRRNLVPGDEIVITWLEHHANIVPWQQIASERGARLKVAPVDERGQVLLEEYEKLLGSRTKIVSLSHVSNALGTIVPVTEMVSMAHRYGAKVLVDGAQAVSHMPVDVQAIDADFYVFSGHKIFGPTGIGAVYGKGAVLEHMPPWQGGGNMIRDVTFERTQFQAAPARFEAGTPNIADAVGLGAALDYVTSLGIENISRYEHDLLEYATPRLLGVPGLRLYGTAPHKAGVLSFTLDGLKTEEIGVALDRQGIAVRAGHHCAQPILRRFGLETSVRASLAPYNTCEDVDALVAALHQLRARPY